MTRQRQLEAASHANAVVNRHHDRGGGKLNRRKGALSVAQHRELRLPRGIVDERARVGGEWWLLAGRVENDRKNVIVSVVRANQLRQGLHDLDADRVQGRMVDREVGDATSDPALDEMIPLL